MKIEEVVMFSFSRKFLKGAKFAKTRKLVNYFFANFVSMLKNLQKLGVFRNLIFAICRGGNNPNSRIFTKIVILSQKPKVV
jgi:hypothetical protein